MLYYKQQTDELPSMYQTDNPLATWQWPVVKLSVCGSGGGNAGTQPPAHVTQECQPHISKISGVFTTSNIF